MKACSLLRFQRCIKEIRPGLAKTQLLNMIPGGVNYSCVVVDDDPLSGLITNRYKLGRYQRTSFSLRHHCSLVNGILHDEFYFSYKQFIEFKRVIGRCQSMKTK